MPAQEVPPHGVPFTVATGSPLANDGCSTEEEIMAMVDRIVHHSRDASRHPALVTPAGNWSYDDLAAATRELTNHLKVGANRPRDVAVIMTGEGEAIAALLGILAADCSAILLPCGLRSADLLHYLALAGAELILLPPTAHALQAVIGPSYQQGVRGVVPVPLSNRSRLSVDSDPWLAQLTSGSLGPSRLAIRARHGIEDEVHAVRDRLALTPSDTTLLTSSLAHSYALIGGLLAGLSSGATVILPDTRDGVRERLRRTKPTVLFGLPSTYQRLLDSSDRLPASMLHRLRWALSAGAPLPDSLFSQVLDRFDLPIRQDYGTTETGTIAIDTSESPRPEQAGIPLPHMEVRLNPLEGTKDTEIQVRSPSTARFYFDQHGPTSCLDGQGWYHTGDAGGMDGLGRLLLGRRLRRRVQIGAAWIDPGVLERRIGEAPGVHDVAILPVRDGAGRHHLKAVVVAPELDLTVVREWCREHLAPEEQPTLLELRDALPRSPAGKVLHRELLEDD